MDVIKVREAEPLEYFAVQAETPGYGVKERGLAANLDSGKYRFNKGDWLLFFSEPTITNQFVIDDAYQVVSDEVFRSEFFQVD